MKSKLELDGSPKTFEGEKYARCGCCGDFTAPADATDVAFEDWCECDVRVIARAKLGALALALLHDVFDPSGNGSLAIAFKHVHADSEEPWEKLLHAAGAAGLIVTCKHCGAEIEQRDGPDDWQDAGSSGLVFCNDQDDTHDDQRHEPEEPRRT